MDQHWQALDRHLSGKYSASAEGSSGPRELKARESSVAMAANIDGRNHRVNIIVKETWGESLSGNA